MRRKGLFRLIAGAIGCLGVVFGGVEALLRVDRS